MYDSKKFEIPKGKAAGFLFNGYEIQEVGDWGGTVEPYGEDEEYDIEPDSTFFSVYGRCQDGTAEIIKDFNSSIDAKEFFDFMVMTLKLAIKQIGGEA